MERTHRDHLEPVKAYDVRYIATSSDETVDANWTVEEDAWSSGDGSFGYAITGLANRTGYDVQVRAVDANDIDGAWSTTASATPTDHGDDTRDSHQCGASERGFGESSTPPATKTTSRFSVSSTADYWMFTTG